MCRTISHRGLWNSGDRTRSRSRIQQRLAKQLLDRFAGAILKGIGDLNRPSDGAHVFLSPVNTQRLVDRRVKVTHGHHAIGNVVALLVASPDHLTSLDPTTRQRQRPAVWPMI